MSSLRRDVKLIFGSAQKFFFPNCFDFSSFATVVGDNINIMKTTFELNFDFYQAFKQHGYTKIWK